MKLSTYKILFRVAAGLGGASVGLTGYLIFFGPQDAIEKSQYFADAVRILENHKSAESILGLPIAVTKPRAVEQEEPSPIANFCANVKGSKTDGTVYFWAERSQKDDSVNIDIIRMELELSSDATKRLIVKAAK